LGWDGSAWVRLCLQWLKVLAICFLHIEQHETFFVVCASGSAPPPRQQRHDPTFPRGILSQIERFPTQTVFLFSLHLSGIWISSEIGQWISINQIQISSLRHSAVQGMESRPLGSSQPQVRCPSAAFLPKLNSGG
jgi:hypothetical protein